MAFIPAEASELGKINFRPAMFANKLFKCNISQDKNLEKKLKLKNYIFDCKS